MSLNTEEAINKLKTINSNDNITAFGLKNLYAI